MGQAVSADKPPSRGGAGPARILPGYPGSKGGSGLAKRIISLMLPHDNYLEPFLGAGVVLRLKKPAPGANVGTDIDPAVIAAHASDPISAFQYQVHDAMKLLSAGRINPGTLIYCDPPYPLETRRGRRYYKNELTDADHLHLLRLLNSHIKTPSVWAMISGYRCELYDEMLHHWHRSDFQTGTRGGARIESVWCSFKPGETFHDTRFLGGDYRERERIKRRRQRWTAKLAAMSSEERAVILEALSSIPDGADRRS